jgi:hypothetical protein
MPGNPDTRDRDGREGTYLFVLPWDFLRERSTALL